MGKHTEGKLAARCGTPFIDTADGETCIFEAIGPRDIGEANARRLVACWNACENVPTEDLETVTNAAIMSPGYIVMSPNAIDVIAALDALTAAQQPTDYRDTPRTDAVVANKPNDWGVTYASTIIEHARQLERELNRARQPEAEFVRVPVEPTCVQDGGRCGVGGYCVDCPHIDHTQDHQSREVTRRAAAKGIQKWL